MTGHIWFIVVSLTGAPTEPFSVGHFPTRAACMATAPERMAGAVAAGIHGRYLCMYHNETDAELSRGPRGAF